MPKKKQKKVEIPLAKPEPMDGDDREIAMLWDKIMAHAPNPFAPVQHPTMYVHASASIPSGPVTGAVIVPVPPPGVHVWTMSAASTVELSPAASPLNTRGGAGSAAAGNPSASTSGSPAGSPERYGASSAHGSSKPTLQQQQISGSAIDAKVTASTLPAAPPIAPIRNVPQTGRQVCRTLSNESSLLHVEAKQREASELTNDLVDAISNETKQLSGLKAALNSDVADLERQKNDEDAYHSTRLVEQQQEFDTARYRLEDELQVLHDDRPRVEALLRHEKETKEGIRARGERLNEMAVDHAAAVKELTASLLLKRQRLETTMTNKMKRTTEEMASLTADQHQARRERAEQERARLTGELAAAEKQSRILAARSRRLTTTTDMLRRDVALESERHTFLSAKNAALARSLQQLVDNLEGLEKKFATEGQGGTNDDDAPQAPNSGRAHHVAALADDPSQLGAVVDQQYEVILQLRRDLVAIKAEIADAETKLKKRQLAVMEGPSTAPFAVTSSALSIRDRASTTSNALVLAGTADAPFVEEYRSKVRSVFMQAVHDVEKGFQSASRSVEDVEDAERQQLLEYVVRRINANIVAPSTFAL